MDLHTTPHTLSRGEPLTSQLVEDSGDGFGTSLTGHVHGELVLLQETEIMSQAMQGPTHRLRGLSGADREQRGRTIPLEACLARSRQRMAGGGPQDFCVTGCTNRDNLHDVFCKVWHRMNRIQVRASSFPTLPLKVTVSGVRCGLCLRVKDLPQVTPLSAVL